MPVARLTDHRLRAGTFGVVDITSSYAISALTVQSDQSIIAWVLDTRLTTPPQRQRRTRTANMTQSADGKYTWRWGFTIMTHLMLDLWLDTYLPANAESALISAMHRDERDEAVFLNATIFRPESFGRPILGGWENVVFEFANGVVIT